MSERSVRLLHIKEQRIAQLEADLKKEKEHNDDLLTEARKSWTMWEEVEQENAKLTEALEYVKDNLVLRLGSDHDIKLAVRTALVEGKEDG